MIIRDFHIAIAELQVFVGIDIGSRTSKAVVLDKGELVSGVIRDTGAAPGVAGEAVLRGALERCGGKRRDIARIVGTGYGRVSMPFADHTLTELSCHGMGAHFLNPAVRTVIDIGGQDSKVIRLDADGNMIDFMMNDKCAAGTGRFLEVAARALEVDIDAFGELADEAGAPCEINSMCAVFAESEVISLLASGETRANVAAGLNRSFARRVGALAKRVGVAPPVVFVGGVAKNNALARAICAYLEVELTPLAIDPQLVGALGAAVIGSRMA